MKNIIVIITLFSAFIVNSQILNYEKELERMVKLPNTPEAEAFAKYGNTSVSMYSGTPNISVPIYTIQGRELDLPINLSYDASGVKVSQMASNVGLNWNLNVGGRISRTINGLADGNLSIVGTSYSSIYYNNNISVGGNATGKKLTELIGDYLNPPSTFPTRFAAETYFKFLKDVSDNKLDTQPDYFSFNALGYSDVFVYDLDSTGVFVALDNPRTQVTASLTTGNNPYVTSWTIITENGTKFSFNLAEITESTNGGPSEVIQVYNSSWFLTQIESPNKKDLYQFTYTDLGLSNTQPVVLVSSVTNEMNDNNPENTSNISTQNTTYKVSQQVLSKIIHNGKEVVNVTLKSRNDFSLASAIDNIKIIKPDGTTLKKYVFNHSYFGNENSSNAFDMRLKLDSIVTQSSLNNTLNSYSFEYFSPENVPSRESLSRDYLGLYNGENNSVLYPKVTVNGTFFSGADRSADFTKAITGTLKKITYPTKGYTEFTFESDKTPYNIDDITASVQDVTYGSLTVSGGIGNSADCGTCCIDQYGNAPKIGANSFNITEAGNYFVSYSRSNGDGEAYLFFRSRVANYSPNLDYDQVIEQSSCAELVTMIWSNFTGSDGDSVYLEPGTYQILLVKGYVISGSGSISLRVHREETTTNGIVGTGEVERAGIRIRNIKDYTDTNILSSEKKYQYTTSLNALNGLDSSGEIVFNPTYYTNSNYQVDISTPDASKGQIAGLNTLTVMTRVNSWSGGNRPHVAYNKVYEVEKATGTDNGYIEHLFNVGWYNGVFSTGVSPGANLYYKDYNIGKERQTHIYKTDNTLKRTDSTTFTNPKYFGNSTIYLKNKVENTFTYVNIKSDGSGGFIYSHDTAFFSDFSFSTGLTGSGSNASKPQSCGNNGLDCMALTYGSVGTLQTYAQGRIGGVLSKASISYNSGATTIQTTNNTYDTAGNYLLRETETLNSKGETITSIFSYPEDFTGEPNKPYSKMVIKNRLTDVIQTESLNGATSLFTQKSEYIDLGNAILVDSINTAKGTNTLEPRILFKRYKDDNLVQVKQVGGTSTAYIWGYNKRYVVAKIVNAIYSDIENLTAFGSGFTLTNGLNSTQKTALRGLLNVLVTTYDYEPMVGVTSITDPNGQTINYEYDEFNRLNQVKDADGKILSNNNYHYKDQQ